MCFVLSKILFLMFVLQRSWFLFISQFAWFEGSPSFDLSSKLLWSYSNRLKVPVIN